jgi:hypothetical protein
MTPSGATLSIVVGLFVAMVVCLEAGYRLARRRLRTEGAAHEGLGSIEAAVFALLGLLLGFAFSQALGRFDARRDMIIDEANAIGTAYLRVDLAPVDDQPRLRQLFRKYLDERIAVYATPRDEAATASHIAAAEDAQRRIWSAVIDSAKRDPSNDVSRVLIPAVNEMIDITTVRTVYLTVGIPPVILILLLVVALCSALTAGYAMAKRGRRSVLHVLLYAASVAMTIYVVLDLEQPRLGLIRLTETDRILGAVRDSIPATGGDRPSR